MQLLERDGFQGRHACESTPGDSLFKILPAGHIPAHGDCVASRREYALLSTPIDATTTKRQNAFKKRMNSIIANEQMPNAKKKWLGGF